MKPEKLTDEELATVLRNTEETLGRVNAGLLRGHIAALETERDEWKQRWQDEDNAARHAREANQAERQRALDAEAARESAQRQGQADHRAIHDALGWARDGFGGGADLPPPLARSDGADRRAGRVQARF